MFGWFRNKKLEKRIAQLEKLLRGKARKPYERSKPSLREHIMTHMADGKVRSLKTIRLEVNRACGKRYHYKGYQGRMSELVAAGKMIRVKRSHYQINK